MRTTILEISVHFDFMTVTVLTQSKLSFPHWVALVLVLGKHYTCQKFAMQLSLHFLYVMLCHNTLESYQTCVDLRHHWV
jgi:hypothetical protein